MRRKERTRAACCRGKEPCGGNEERKKHRGKGANVGLRARTLKFVLRNDEALWSVEKNA